MLCILLNKTFHSFFLSILFKLKVRLILFKWTLTIYDVSSMYWPSIHSHVIVKAVFNWWTITKMATVLFLHRFPEDVGTGMPENILSWKYKAGMYCSNWISQWQSQSITVTMINLFGENYISLHIVLICLMPVEITPKFGNYQVRHFEC